MSKFVSPCTVLHFEEQHTPTLPHDDVLRDSQRNLNESTRPAVGFSKVIVTLYCTKKIR